MIKIQYIISLKFYYCRCRTQLFRGLLRARFPFIENNSIYTPVFTKILSEKTQEQKMERQSTTKHYLHTSLNQSFPKKSVKRISKCNKQV